MLKANVLLASLFEYPTGGRDRTQLGKGSREIIEGEGFLYPNPDDSHHYK